LNIIYICFKNKKAVGIDDFQYELKSATPKLPAF
jgi:hypothetical protein